MPELKLLNSRPTISEIEESNKNGLQIIYRFWCILCNCLSLLVTIPIDGSESMVWLEAAPYLH